MNPLSLTERIIELEKIVEELFKTIKMNNVMLKSKINALKKKAEIEIKPNQKGE
jgi:hypothetical protein